MGKLTPALVFVLAAACNLRPGPGHPSASDEARLSSAASVEAPSGDLDTFGSRALWIDVYGSYAGKCIIASNEAGIDKSRAVFNECYDWHSAVHAHWAILRADLKGAGTKLAESAKLVDSRLSTAALEKIKADLQESDYEMPYGRAWFLRLAGEHEIWGKARAIGDPERLRELGNWVAASMMAYYAAHTPSPKNADYRNDSWSMAQLLVWFRQTGDTANEAKVMAFVKQEFIEKPLTWADSTDTNPSVFFSLYWNWAYALTVALGPEKAIAAIGPELLPQDALTPIAAPNDTGNSDVHHLGINWSRAWGIKALARDVIAIRGATDPTARKLAAAYFEHVKAGRARHNQYKDNYYAYSHWVPQFGIYGITD